MCMRLLCTRKRLTASSSPCVAGRGDGGGIERIKQAAAEKSLPKSMLAAISMLEVPRKKRFLGISPPQGRLKTESSCARVPQAPAHSRFTQGHRAAPRASDTRIHAGQKTKTQGSRDTHEIGTRTSRIHAVRGEPIPREYLLITPSRNFLACGFSFRGRHPEASKPPVW